MFFVNRSILHDIKKLPRATKGFPWTVAFTLMTEGWKRIISVSYVISGVNLWRSCNGFIKFFSFCILMFNNWG